MEPEWVVMRVAYMVLFVTLMLMAWAYMIQAEAVAEPLVAGPLSISIRGHQENLQDMHPPCSFNPLCTCSKPGPIEFGIVACHNVPLGNIPIILNSSRVFSLSMIGNDMKVLQEKRLFGSGLWRLKMQKNDLHYIADDSFVGLSKFLSELDLAQNRLTVIPNAALRRLAKQSKLRFLNLGHNGIADITAEDFHGLPASITSLGLAGNLITYLQEDIFLHLPRLKKIDLSENSIQSIHGQSLSISQSLKHLYLSNNLLQIIPFEALEGFDLKDLDLSKNLLKSIFDVPFEEKLTVKVLNLEYNRISTLTPFAFQNFRNISVAKLAYNLIETLPDDSFNGANIIELDLSHCFVSHIQPQAFRGIEGTLQNLDLSFNNISQLPPEIFENASSLRTLNLDHQNKLRTRSKDSLRGEAQNYPRLLSLHRISMIGDPVASLSTDHIQKMSSLRSLRITNIGIHALTPEVFMGFGLGIEDVKISQGKLTSIMASAFSPLTGLKSLDLSENQIHRMDNNAFEGIGHSVHRLILHNALRMEAPPAKLLQKLTAVNYLDMSNNALSSIADNTFFESKNLLQLNLRFNKLSSLPHNLFDYNRVPKLQTLFLSFNNIKEIKESTFSRLEELEVLELNENEIQIIHSKAFHDLPNLKILNLAGNKVFVMEDEAFENLPRLQLLNLSHNRLNYINLEALVQLGTLSSFGIDISYNNIQRLNIISDTTILDTVQNPSEISLEENDEDEEDTIYITNSLDQKSSSSIEFMNLSHNNISFISPYFFVPISSTLIELDLSHNSLQNLSLAHLSGMRFLQTLKLGHNMLDTVEYNAFEDSKHIQIINFDNNMLRDLPPDLFDECVTLRAFSVAGNKIRALSDSTFKGTQLEILNVANNRLTRFPENALARVANTLTKLDLSGNGVSSLSQNQIECLQRLRWLDLSNNRIVVVGDSAFDTLHSLLHLDIAGNPLGRISTRLFSKVKDSLLHMHLSNMSLENLPEFDTFSHLLTLNFSYNRLTHMPPNFNKSFPNIKTLDLSGNDMSLNTVWNGISQVESLRIGKNPIKILTNDSFLKLERLHELDMSDLPLESVQIGLFNTLGNLKSLTIGPLLPSINPSSLIQSVESLQSIHLKMENSTMTSELQSYSLPPKLSNITVSGEQLLSIAPGSLDGIFSRTLTLTIYNTGINDLSSNVLHNLGDVTQFRLYIWGNNSALKTIGNPNSQFRREPFATYLEDLELEEGLSLSCSCQAGWIEFWLRQWMEEICPIGLVTPKEDIIRCNKMLQMLRNVQCQNNPGAGLMQIFVSDLECGWQSSASPFWKNRGYLQHFFSAFPVISASLWLLLRE